LNGFGFILGRLCLRDSFASRHVIDPLTQFSYSSSIDPTIEGGQLFVQGAYVEVILADAISLVAIKIDLDEGG